MEEIFLLNTNFISPCYIFKQTTSGSLTSLDQQTNKQSTNIYIYMYICILHYISYNCYVVYDGYFTQAVVLNNILART